MLAGAGMLFCHRLPMEMRFARHTQVQDRRANPIDARGDVAAPICKIFVGDSPGCPAKGCSNHQQGQREDSCRQSARFGQHFSRSASSRKLAADNGCKRWPFQAAPPVRPLRVAIGLRSCTPPDRSPALGTFAPAPSSVGWARGQSKKTDKHHHVEPRDYKIPCLGHARGRDQGQDAGSPDY